MSSVNLVLKTSHIKKTITNISYDIGLKWLSYDGYHFGNVNYLDTATFLPYSGTSNNFSSFYSANNNVFPNAKQDYYTIGWLGYFLCDITGLWTFSITNPDDGVFLWIDDDNNNLATSGYTSANSINNGGIDGENKISSRSFNLTVNKYYFIRVIFGDKTGGQNMTLTFTNPNNVSNNGIGYLFNKINTTTIINDPLLWQVNMESLLGNIYNEYDRFKICLQYIAGSTDSTKNLLVKLTGLPFQYVYNLGGKNNSTITIGTIKDKSFNSSYSLSPYYSFTRQAMANILIEFYDLENNVKDNTNIDCIFSFNIIGDENFKKIYRLL